MDDHLYYQVLAGVLFPIFGKFVRIRRSGRSRIGPDTVRMRGWRRTHVG
jgi:hypothetical protein